MKFSFLKSERRKRVQIPKSILFSGILLLSFPAINLVYLHFYYEISVWEVLEVLDWKYIFFFVCAPVLGIGLLFVRKWAWWGLLVFSGALVSFDAITLFSTPDKFHIFSLGFTFAGFTLLFFFLRKDIAAPYFKLYPRGFRAEKRDPIQISVNVDGQLFTTKDVSETGIYVNWKDCNRNLGDEVLLEFPESKSLEKNLQNVVTATRKGGVVRIDPNGAGIAFRK